MTGYESSSGRSTYRFLYTTALWARLPVGSSTALALLRLCAKRCINSIFFFFLLGSYIQFYWDIHLLLVYYHFYFDTTGCYSQIWECVFNELIPVSCICRDRAVSEKNGHKKTNKTKKKKKKKKKNERFKIHLSFIPIILTQEWCLTERRENNTRTRTRKILYPDDFWRGLIWSQALEDLSIKCTENVQI